VELTGKADAHVKTGMNGSALAANMITLCVRSSVAFGGRMFALSGCR
jgi:hypothetical protein